MIEFDPCFYCSVKSTGSHCESCAWPDVKAKLMTAKAELAEANAIKDELRSAVRTMQETINGRFVTATHGGESCFSL